MFLEQQPYDPLGWLPLHLALRAGIADGMVLGHGAQL